MEAIGILIMSGSHRQITEAWAWMPRNLFRGWEGWGFMCKARVAHRSPPRRFFGGCSCEGAIDFAELRMRICGAEA